jgi:hypothetical protein
MRRKSSGNIRRNPPRFISREKGTMHGHAVFLAEGD